MSSQIITDSSKRNWVIASVGIAAFMSILDASIVNISLPEIASQFKVSTNEVSRVVLSYQVFLTGTLLLFGKLADRRGLKRIIMAGYIVFILGSLLCGLSSNLHMLVLFRCLQGIGASMLYSNVPAVIPKFLPVNVRGSAYGVFSMVSAIGLSVGAPLGGIITQYLNWNWIFFINIPIGITAFFIVSKVFPDDKIVHSETEEYKFDYIGVLFSFLSIILLIYVLNIGQKAGWLSSKTLISLALCILFIVLFLIREKTYRYPVISLKLIKNKKLTLALFSTLFGIMFMAGNNFMMPFYIIHTRGLTTDQAGFVMIFFSLIFVIVAPISGKLSDKIASEKICAVAMLTASLAGLFFTFTLGYNGLLFAIVFLALMGFSFAAFISPNNNMVLGLAPEGETGIVSGIMRTFFNLGNALGVSFSVLAFNSVLTAEQISKAYDPSETQTLEIELIPGFRMAVITGVVTTFISFVLIVISIFISRNMRKKGEHMESLKEKPRYVEF